ncbi:hypothetical protein N9V68_00855 [Octadecabacter sp.]|nr:hypothetical protein [Octadecabacter sp.]
MPYSSKIFPDIGLVYVRYWGVANIETTQASILACASDPEFRPDMRHFFDVSGVTRVNADVAEVMKMQAKLAEVYRALNIDYFAVFLAPDGPPRQMAEMARKSWDAMPYMTMRILDTYDAVVEVLQLNPADIARLSV